MSDLAELTGRIQKLVGADADEKWGPQTATLTLNVLEHTSAPIARPMTEMIARGKMSTFGGPFDTGVKPDEGLALIEEVDLTEWWFARIFLPEQPKGTTGLARRLNPEAFYVAMRFNFSELSRWDARRVLFRLRNPDGGKSIFAQAADWGPNIRTHRFVDMSPGAAAYLNLVTDDIVEVEVISP